MFRLKKWQSPKQDGFPNNNNTVVHHFTVKSVLSGTFILTLKNAAWSVGRQYLFYKKRLVLGHCQQEQLGLTLCLDSYSCIFHLYPILQELDCFSLSSQKLKSRQIIIAKKFHGFEFFILKAWRSLVNSDLLRNLTFLIIWGLGFKSRCLEMSPKTTNNLVPLFCC